MKEWHRTVVLLCLIAAAVGFIIWSQHASSSNLLVGLPT